MEENKSQKTIMSLYELRDVYSKFPDEALKMPYPYEIDGTLYYQPEDVFNLLNEEEK